MSRGRILKVKEGHEANCSSGMIALTILVGAAVSLLPVSLIVAGIQADKLGRGRSPTRRSLYWLIPAGLGVVAALLTAWWASSSGFRNSDLFIMSLVSGGLFILATATGYIMAPKMKRPAWLVLIEPMIIAIGLGLQLLISPTGVLVLLVAGLIIVLVSGSSRSSAD